MNRKTMFPLLFAISTLLIPVCTTAAEFQINRLSDTKFTVDGAAMVSVSAIKAQIDYEPKNIGAPVITAGEIIPGALLQSNPGVPGKLTVAILSPSGFSGSGRVLTVVFPAGQMVTIKGFTAEALNSKIQPIDLKATINDPVPQDNNAENSPPPATSPAPPPVYLDPQQQIIQEGRGTVAATTTGGTSIGTLTLPDSMKRDDSKNQDPQLPPNSQPQPDQPQPLRLMSDEPPKPEPTIEKKAKAEVNRVNYLSVLDRFRENKGERTVTALKGLFVKPVASIVSQTPSVAISDGITPLTLKVTPDLKEDENTPTFAVSGAKILSIQGDPISGGWIFELLPAKGTVEAALTLSSESSFLNIPLVLVPKLNGVAVSEKDGIIFLKDGGATNPLFDLNKDGRHDYTDDYIYIGNMLINAGNGGGKP